MWRLWIATHIEESESWVYIFIFCFDLLLYILIQLILFVVVYGFAQSNDSESDSTSRRLSLPLLLNYLPPGRKEPRQISFWEVWNPTLCIYRVYGQFLPKPTVSEHPTLKTGLVSHLALWRLVNRDSESDAVRSSKLLVCSPWWQAERWESTRMKL